MRQHQPQSMVSAVVWGLDGFARAALPAAGDGAVAEEAVGEGVAGLPEKATDELGAKARGIKEELGGGEW